MKYVWKATDEEKNTFEGHKRKSGETSAIGSSGGPSHLGFGNDEEAITVASLIAAAIAIPEYAGATFGVIAMVGNSQAL
jgi:catalase (peroxidase I)